MSQFGFAFLTAYQIGATGNVDLTYAKAKVIALAVEAIKKVEPIPTNTNHPKGGSVVHTLDPSERQWKAHKVYETPNEVHAAMNPVATDIHAKNHIAIGVDAAGADQANATQLTKYLNEVDGGTATTDDGVKLPAAATNKHVVVINSNTFAIDIFPATDDTINGGSANAAITLAAGARIHLVADGAVNWNQAVDTTQ